MISSLLVQFCYVPRPPIWDRLFLKRDSSCPLLVPLRRFSYWSTLLEAVGCCSLALSVLPLLKTSLYQPFAISEFISMHNRFVEYLCWEHTCFPHLGSTPFSALINSWQVASNTSSNFTACFWATGMEEEDYGTWVSPQKRALCLLRKFLGSWFGHPSPFICHLVCVWSSCTWTGFGYPPLPGPANI